jgi:urea carboxylase
MTALMAAIGAAEDALPARRHGGALPHRAPAAVLGRPATRLAIEKYMQSVRPDAPWCPSNIEFIRRINGLDSIDEVQRIVFEASYLVMGLGDVYLGAPVATPLDPRHRLVTTKYNPARTWTPRTPWASAAPTCASTAWKARRLPVRRPHGADVEPLARCAAGRHEAGKPWLLRFFDQIRFYPVSEAEDCCKCAGLPRRALPAAGRGRPLPPARLPRFPGRQRRRHRRLQGPQQAAFEAERERWRAAGQAEYASEPRSPPPPPTAKLDLPEHARARRHASARQRLEDAGRGRRWREAGDWSSSSR